MKKKDLLKNHKLNAEFACQPLLSNTQSNTNFRDSRLKQRCPRRTRQSFETTLSSNQTHNRIPIFRGSRLKQRCSWSTRQSFETTLSWKQIHNQIPISETFVWNNAVLEANTKSNTNFQDSRLKQCCPRRNIQFYKYEIPIYNTKSRVVCCKATYSENKSK